MKVSKYIQCSGRDPNRVPLEYESRMLTAIVAKFRLFLELHVFFVYFYVELFEDSHHNIKI